MSRPPCSGSLTFPYSQLAASLPSFVRSFVRSSVSVRPSAVGNEGAGERASREGGSVERTGGSLSERPIFPCWPTENLGKLGCGKIITRLNDRTMDG